MMEVYVIKQVIEMLLLSFTAFIFCAAIKYLFIGTENIKELQIAISNIDNVIYEENFKTIDEIVYTKSDIIVALMAEKIEYDIEVSGVLYQKAIHNCLSLREHTINRANYKKEYILSQNGKVLKVLYSEY